MRALPFFVIAALAACGGSITDTDGGHGATDMHVADAPASDGMTADDLGGGCTTDADGDGHRTIACGGDDCDDADPNRYPGNHEVCDAANHDEDCDPRTFGARDNDGDGVPDALCCNTDAMGTMHCGTDCDDMSASTHPGANETCNGIDDDCDGMIDDVLSSVYLDCDGDGFGADMTAMLGCPRAVMPGECTTPAAGARWVAQPGDCNDMNASVHPGATELCNTIDDDCNMTVDEGCDCTTGMMRPCGTDVGACAAGSQTCISGHWDTCGGAGFIGASSESCNGQDDDCNGIVDDVSTEPACYRDADGDGAVTSSTTAAVDCVCPGGYRLASTPVDCCDSDPSAHPGVSGYFTSADACGDFDYDCSGTLEQDPGAPSDTTVYFTRYMITPPAEPSCPGSCGLGRPGCLGGTFWYCEGTLAGGSCAATTIACGAVGNTMSCPGTGTGSGSLCTCNASSTSAHRLACH